MKALRWLVILLIGFYSVSCTDDSVTPQGEDDDPPPSHGGGGGGGGSI
jgi:hypothetical protein